MCLECKSGYNGENCSLTCESGYFGRQCNERCRCSQDEYCDPARGCLCNSTIDYCREPGYILEGNMCLECNPGYTGKNCSLTCTYGYFGRRCDERCRCSQDEYCDPARGCLECNPGYTGGNCSSTCPSGYFGRQCNERCRCSQDEYCDPARGCLCNSTSDYCREQGVSIERIKEKQPNFLLPHVCST
uniref:Multiple epidermal growth factor-like domains 10 n=1 Tax=Magallana gigas TaxID=29159 RepID=A0A8W8KGR3_MAGGI